MAVKIDAKGALTICRVDGEIDITSSPGMKKAFDKLIATKAPKMVIELSQVTYIDSSGLATLVEILKGMRSYGGKMRLAGMSPKIKSLFEITKLDKLFEIMASEEEAVAGM